MSQNDGGQQPAAPLISVRRSFQLRTPAFLILGIGLWLVVGVLALFGQVRDRVGANTVWAYLAVGLLILPTILSHVELRSWIGYSGGSYRLLRAMERNQLTFLAGWTYLLGWAALSALIARSFVTYASNLLTVVSSVEVADGWLIAALLAFFVITNILGLRLPWRFTVWVAGLVTAGIVALAVLLVVYRFEAQVGASPPASGSGVSSGGFFATVLILIASLWVVEFATEIGSRRRRNLWTTFALLVGGPLIGGLLAVANWWGAPTAATIEALADAVLPGVGVIVVLAAATAALAVAWQVLGLLMLRRLQVVGLDGWLPGWLIRPYTRLETPVMLILFQVALTPAALGVAALVTHIPGVESSSFVILAALAALAFIVIEIEVDIEAILLANHPRAADRSFKLPLYPAIPATGAAINLLLILAAPWPVIALTVVWGALGALVYSQIGLERMRTSRLGVTVFQDTEHQADVKSHYPVLVPVANPDTALALVSFGAAIARAHGGHVSVMQVVQIPEHLPLDSGRVEARERQELLEQVLEDAHTLGVPVEGITRLARSVRQGILDTIAEESAELVVMGWNAREVREGQRGLGHIIDAVLQNAACSVVVVRGDSGEVPSRALVPMSGGPHAPVAATLALDLTAPVGGEVTLLNVVRDVDDPDAVNRGMELVKEAREELRAPARVHPRVVTSDSVLKGILTVLEDHDVVLIGASERDFLDEQLFGRLPIQIAERSDRMLVLVRGYTGLTGYVARRAWTSLSNLLPTLNSEEQIDAYHRMRQAAQPNVNFFVLTAASAIIATLGLLLNSPAVIIGAMLVAPLMSPFIAVAMGIVSGDARIIRNALTAIVQGTLVAIFLAIVSALISPLAEATPEVLSRTQPNLLDLMVALVSGVAGAYAIARKEVSAALPGVAIAAALVPPLGSVGIGVALGDVSVALGALLLYTTNLVAIVFGGAIVFLMLGIRPPQRPERRRWLRQGLIISILSLILVSIPLGVVLYRAVDRGRIESRAQAIVTEQVAQWGAVKLVDFNVDVGWRQVEVVGTLYALEDTSAVDVTALDTALESALHRSVEVRLFTIEGSILDSSAPPDGGS
jgi:uncharacterized hydrophobic protein (TIGR00271 family)